MEQKGKISCLPVKSATDSLLDNIEKTYIDSFPEVERRAFYLVRELIDKNSAFTMFVVMKDGVYVGFISVWEFESFKYIEHFSIDESARNGGIGAKVLNEFIGRTDKPIVLEVEMPVDEMCKRRVCFYERLGFVLDTNRYYQPSYDGCLDNTLEMRLMSFGNIDMGQSFEGVKNELYKEVYSL